MKNFIKENWFKLVIAFVIVLISFSFFYYYVVREKAKDTARRYCNQWAKNETGSNQARYDNYFARCLREQGVSD